MGEFELVAKLRELFSEGTSSVHVGIGDDAAVLLDAAGNLVLTVDAQVEGTHFERGWLSLEDLGYRSIMCAASDIAAMGASPVSLLSALELPEALSDEDVLRIGQGQAEAARVLSCPVVGGNIAKSQHLGITVTVVGRAATLLLRSAARPGDQVFLAGACGDAALGLRCVQAGHVTGTDIETVVGIWRRPTAHIAEGLAAVRAGARAGIDVSDGLVADAAHIASESGVRVVLLEEALRAHISASAHAVGMRLSCDPFESLLFGGEDYALLVAAKDCPTGFHWVGEVTEGGGVFLRGELGRETELTARRYEHRR